MIGKCKSEWCNERAYILRRVVENGTSGAREVGGISGRSAFARVQFTVGLRSCNTPH